MPLSGTMKAFVLVCLGFDLVNSALVFGLGGCPTVQTKSDFVAATYLGKWYEYMRFNNWFEAGLKCTYAQYTDEGNGIIGVKNGGINRITGREQIANGQATVPDGTKPGELKVSFSNFDFTSGANYLILDTNYVDYTLIFSCTNVPLLPFTIQTAWILTRDRGTAPSNLASLESTLENYGIPSDRLKLINQSGCTN